MLCVLLQHEVVEIIQGLITFSSDFTHNYYQWLKQLLSPPSPQSTLVKHLRLLLRYWKQLDKTSVVEIEDFEKKVHTAREQGQINKMSYLSACLDAMLTELYLSIKIKPDKTLAYAKQTSQSTYLPMAFQAFYSGLFHLKKS